MEMTPEVERAYLESNGTHCPYCSSPDITTDGFDGESASQQVSCNKCDKAWVDCYKLVGILEA